MSPDRQSSLMSDSADFDVDAARRTQVAGHTPRHPIPNVQRYRENQKKREHREPPVEHIDSSDESKGQENSLRSSAKERLHLKSPSNPNATKAPYHNANRNIDYCEDDERDSAQDDASTTRSSSSHTEVDSANGGTQATNTTTDPRQKRKNAKHMRRSTKGREVTDPVTHLKVLIHDQTEKDLEHLSENEDPAQPIPLDAQMKHNERAHAAMERLFPSPDFNQVKNQIQMIAQRGLLVGIGSVMTMSLLVAAVHSFDLSHRKLAFTISTTILLVFAFASYSAIHTFVQRKVSSICDDQVWTSHRHAEQSTPQSNIPESAQWLNSIFNSVWSLINPDLFTSLADNLEDVMQASLPKMVRMVSVDDLGQGSEALRILGVKWLPAGAASKGVSGDGIIEHKKNKSKDRKVPGQGELDSDGTAQKGQDEGSPSQRNHDKTHESETNDENMAEGMEAEEGDFVNVELGFAYRASSKGEKTLRSRAKNAHLYLAFYLPGGIRFPVWVELRGIIGIMRMRLQLCPDPPFFSLCTITLLGQPKAEMSCVPLTKKGLNIMNLPLISSFVQSSLDAALAEYVAPKSLTLDLKEMLMGDDFKKDTMYKGALLVRIKRSKGFKVGDPGLAGLTRGSTDGYVTVSWAKYGKPVWSTRVIVDNMNPCWEEVGFVLFGPEELNADERLRVQLWDSDRSSADDDLGKIEIDLKELTHSSRYARKMSDRDDGFFGMGADESMPGSLEWSIGYFPKTTIEEYNLEQQKVEPEVDTERQLKEKVSKDVDQKLQEATQKNESIETNQQKAQDLKAREDAMIISTAPSQDFPTGILSVQVHNITGLELEKLNKSDKDDADDADSVSDDLPSAYCTIILNHQKVFKTRTKPKNSKPFFNAGTERLIRDWRTTEVMISVRDARVHENDPLLGILYLPLGKIFKHRSQIIDSYPLMSGIGYGRLRVSMVFRSITYQAPPELRGWDYGTLEITKPIEAKDLAPDLVNLRLKVRTSIGRCKMYMTNQESPSMWAGKKNRAVRLAVRKRYATYLLIEFRKHRAGPDITPAFAVLWLKDIPDEEEVSQSLPIWRNDGHNLKVADSSCIEALGEKAGSLIINLRFWRGLSDYHRKLASKNPSLSDVFEVLDVARDSREVRDMIADQESDSDSSDSDDENNPIKGLSNKVQSFGRSDHGGGSDDGNRGPLDQVKDYGDHSKQLHRQNRGIMQYQAPRTAAWMKTKIQHGKDHIMDSFKHHDREPDIETEV